MRDTRAYVRAAIEREVARVRSAPAGTRAIYVFASAAALGNLVGAGLITEEEVGPLVVAAAEEAGLPRREAEANAYRGLRHGVKTPRQVPPTVPRVSSRPSSSPSSAPSPRHPPAQEVAALWSDCGPLGLDAEVATYVRGRGLEPDDLDLWDLARALPREAAVPSWARCRGTCWSASGHRLLVRVWNARGEPASVRARCVQPTESALKSLAPSGYETKGLVLADPLGSQLFRGEVPEWWVERDVVISEGEFDFLTWATRQSDAQEQGPAVLGVTSGAWTPELAARLPDGARVVLRTHHDVAGERYAASIHATLAGRCTVLRSRAGGVG